MALAQQVQELTSPPQTVAQPQFDHHSTTRLEEQHMQMKDALQKVQEQIYSLEEKIVTALPLEEREKMVHKTENTETLPLNRTTCSTSVASQYTAAPGIVSLLPEDGNIQPVSALSCTDGNSGFLLVLDSNGQLQPWPVPASISVHHIIPKPMPSPMPVTVSTSDQGSSAAPVVPYENVPDNSVRPAGHRTESRKRTGKQLNRNVPKPETQRAQNEWWTGQSTYASSNEAPESLTNNVVQTSANNAVPQGKPEKTPTPPNLLGRVSAAIWPQRTQAPDPKLQEISKLKSEVNDLKIELQRTREELQKEKEMKEKLNEIVLVLRGQREGHRAPGAENHETLVSEYRSLFDSDGHHAARYLSKFNPKCKRPDEVTAEEKKLIGEMFYDIYETCKDAVLKSIFEDVFQPCGNDHKPSGATNDRAGLYGVCVATTAALISGTQENNLLMRSIYNELLKKFSHEALIAKISGGTKQPGDMMADGQQHPGMSASGSEDTLRNFLIKSIQLAWRMVTIQPPMIVKFPLNLEGEYDSEIHEHDTKHWPAKLKAQYSYNMVFFQPALYRHYKYQFNHPEIKAEVGLIKQPKVSQPAKSTMM